MTFEVRLGGTDIFKLSLPKSGLSYGPEYEWREAARWAGYRYETEFCALEGDEQSRIVAHFRCHFRAEAAVAAEQARKARRRQNQRKPGKG